MTRRRWGTVVAVVAAVAVGVEAGAVLFDHDVKRPSRGGRAFDLSSRHQPPSPPRSRRPEHRKPRDSGLATSDSPGAPTDAEVERELRKLEATGPCKAPDLPAYKLSELKGQSASCPTLGVVASAAAD